MTTKSNHIIQKNVLEVEMENPADAFQFRIRLGEVMHEKILPQMEILFDEMAGQGQVYRMEKLEIDAGVLEMKNWEEELTQRTIAKLKQSLLLQSPKVKVEGLIEDTPAKNYFKPETIDVKATTFTDDEFADLLMHYLQHGSLPWYAPLHTRLQQQFAQWLQAKPVDFVKAFVAYATTSQLTRLIYFAGEEQLDEIFKVLFDVDEPASLFASFIKAKNELLTILAKLPAFDKAAALKAVYVPVFKWFAVGKQSGNFYQYYAQQSALLFKSFFKVDELLFINEHLKETPDFLLTKIKEQLTVSVDSTLIPLEDLQKDEETETSNERLAQEMFVSNAGLVLLHPFLPALFSELKLIVENKFVNEAAHMKAVVLMQYLVDGLHESEDHALLLNKILCGFPPAQPVMSNLQLTNQDTDEANDLLLQVIQLWKKNGVQVNGTIGGLRQSFLQRQARLNTKNNDWQLRVEQKPYDLVLSSLPWTISIIKTPWMQEMLWVEWS